MTNKTQQDYQILPSTPSASSSLSTSTSDDQNNELNEPAKSRLFILEPAILLLFLSWNLASSVLTNQIILQTCTTILGVNQTDCLLLGTENEGEDIQKLELKVQPYVSEIQMTKSMIESIIPAVVSLFVGPWSDKFGRRPVMLTSTFGYFLSYLLTSLLSYFSIFYLINPWFYLITIFPVVITGGNCTLIISMFAYLTDVTSQKNRALKMGTLSAALYVGLLIGGLSSSYVLKYTNSTTVFGISAIAAFLSFAYILLSVDESVQNNEIQTGSKFKAIFKIDNVTDMFKACFKKRPKFDRTIIWLLIVAMSLSIFVLEGSMTVTYLFVREKFAWTLKEFSFYGSTSIVLQIIGNLIGMYFLRKYLGLSETVLALLAIVSAIIESVILSASSESWHLYLAVSVSFLRSIVGPMCRAVLSNIVSSNDAGKVFSLTSSFESISPMGSAPLYTYIYTKTLDTFPAAFNLISAGTYVICFILILIVYFLKRRDSQDVTYTSLNT